MNILVGKCFGIGNAVMAIPIVKALQIMGNSVDVLVGSGPDDSGASDVLRHVANRVFTDFVPDGLKHDVAIMAIPFDGRWKNGVHFIADRVMDGRPRPDPSTFGFSSWEKHEVEYQMENAAELGWDGPTPSSSFFNHTFQYHPKQIYLGIGYKRDKEGYWAKKHWGNDNYIQLIKLLLESDRSLSVCMTGGPMDMVQTMAPISRGVSDSRLRVLTPNLRTSMEIAAASGYYIGNDTGMMHVAAAHGVPCVGIFMLEGTKTKNSPWGASHRVLEGHVSPPSPEEVFKAYKEIACIS